LPGMIFHPTNRPDFSRLTSGPINAIYFHSKHGSFWGG
jgi:hypothetical protein